MNPAAPAVGIVGLGAMGAPIARNLVGSGVRVVGYDLEPDRVTALERAGGERSSSVEELAAHVPVIITLLPSDNALQDVTRRVATAARGGRCPGLTVVEMSTFSEATKRAAWEALHPLGVDVVDCPLSGTAVQAAAGDLVVYASGDPETIERCRPILELMARSIHVTGAFGTGARTKLVANLLVAVHIVAAAEALVLAQRAGLDLDTTLPALVDGAGSSRMLAVRGPMMTAGAFQPPSMTLKLFKKDQLLIEQFAAALGSPAPLFSAAMRVFQQAEDEGRGGDDTASVFASLAAAAERA